MSDDMEDFDGDDFEDDPYFASDAGQLIAGAHCYLTGARELRYSHTYKERPTVLFKPTLHLVAHGIELLLKFPLVRSGESIDAVRLRFGHRLMSLWEAIENENLRVLVLMNAREAWAEAGDSSLFPEDDFTRNPDQELTEKLATLAQLHGSESNYALRYLVPPYTAGPRAAFLIDAFGRTAEHLVKNPSALDF